LAVLTGA